MNAPREIRTEPLTAASFAGFGDVLEAAGAADMIINQGKCDRFHDRARLDFGPGGRAGLSIFRAEARALPYRLDLLERHPDGSQAFIPMSQAPFLVIVAADESGKPGAPPVPFGRVELHEVREGLQRVSELPVVRPEASRKLLVSLPPDCTRVAAEPVKRPLASLNSVLEVEVKVPLDPHRLAAVPVSLPLASRYSVRLWPPEPRRVTAVPSSRPEASRIVARELSPEPSLCSMV